MLYARVMLFVFDHWILRNKYFLEGERHAEDSACETWSATHEGKRVINRYSCNVCKPRGVALANVCVLCCLLVVDILINFS